jgi:hypothetical protein
VRGQPGHVAAGVLDPDDPAGEAAGQFDRGFGFDIGHGPAGHIVKHHRQIDRFGQKAEMGEQSGLGRAVVIGCDHQGGLGPQFLGNFQVPQRGLGIVAAAARDHRDPASCLLDADFEQPVLLIIGQRRRFPSGAARDECAGALFDLPIDQPPKRGFIDSAVFKRGNQSWYRAGEHGLYPCNCAIGASFSLP